MKMTSHDEIKYHYLPDFFEEHSRYSDDGQDFGPMNIWSSVGRRIECEEHVVTEEE